MNTQNTATFSCPEIPGVIFDYSLFPGFDRPFMIATGEHACAILLDAIPKGTFPDSAAQIAVSGPEAADGSLRFDTENPHGIFYATKPSGQGYWFMSKNGAISIDLLNIPANPSFDRDAFWKTVVASFKEI